VPEQSIKAMYANTKADWWVPLRDLPESRRADAVAKLGGIPGIEVRSKAARTYPNGSLAVHVVGYIGPTTASDLTQFAAQGYEEGDFIGRDGIEAWAERDLAGVKGGRLLIADGDGNTVRTIAQRKAEDGKAVQLTIDLDVQQVAEKSLGDKVGSIVVLDPRDNSVLAMVSHPSFDPNAFVTGISDQDWQKLSGDPMHPFQNRATMSAYPTGSIFKVITMDAALEKGGFRPDSPFDCNGVWTGLPGVVMHDWVAQGHGHLDLQEGLVESCDIVFYELGKKLDSLDSSLLPDYAKQFGLGQLTGIDALDEAKGTVPDPDWKQSVIKQPWYPGDAVNLAIGQGYLEATPLQMANVYSALANGGELRTPLLVRQIGQGDAAQQFVSQVRGRIPGSAATLSTIRVAMKQVAASPKGTAYYAFQGFQVPTAAKTGSAENQNPDAHAWFAGYAPADAPQIVVLVMVEGGKAGGEVAAPLGRQIIAGYFAQPQ
jgi:penicillin-binding protein 2